MASQGLTKCVFVLCAVLLLARDGDFTSTVAPEETTSASMAMASNNPSDESGATEMYSYSGYPDSNTVEHNTTELITTTPSPPSPPEPELPPLLDYRLFYTRKQWRARDGTHDGEKFDTYAVDQSKISEYYFEHYKNGEIWMLRMNNRPDVIYPIWPLLANLWKTKKGIIHYTNRRIDVTLYSVFGGIGLIVNGLMLAVMFVNQDQQTPTNVLLCSVAIGDICYMVFTSVFSLLDEHYQNDIDYNDHFCKSFIHFRTAFYCLTVLHNTTIAMERYLAICWPMKVMATATKLRSIKIAVGLWLLAFILPSILTYFMYMFGQGLSSRCIYAYEHWEWEMKLLYGYDVILLFIVPMCIMIFAYTSITITLKKSIDKSKGMTSDKKSEKDDKALKARIQVIKLLWVICILFFISWLPRCIIKLAAMRNYGKLLTDIDLIFKTDRPLVIIDRLERIAFLNSIMNPIVFFFMSKPFRDHTIRLVTCGKVIMKSQDASSMSKRTGSTGISRGQSSSAGAKATQKSSAQQADKGTSSGKSDSSKPAAAITDKPNGNPHASTAPDNVIKDDGKADIKDDTKTDANADSKTDTKNNI